MRTFMVVSLLLLACLGCGDYEANRRVNFDACSKRCADTGTTMKRFEQGLGYVACECNP